MEPDETLGGPNLAARIQAFSEEQQRVFEATLSRMERQAPAQRQAFEEVWLNGNRDYDDLRQKHQRCRGNRAGERSGPVNPETVMNAATRAKARIMREAPWLWPDSMREITDVGY